MGEVIHIERRGPQLEDGYTSIANELLEALASHAFSAREMRVLLAVIRKTYGFHRREAPMSISSLAGLCGLERSAVARTVRRLIERGVLIRSVVGKSRSAVSRIEMNKYYLDWRVASTRDDCGQTDVGLDGDCGQINHSREPDCGQNDHSQDENYGQNDHSLDENCGQINHSDVSNYGQNDHSRAAFEQGDCGQIDHRTVVKSTTVLNTRVLKEGSAFERKKDKDNTPPYPPNEIPVAAVHVAEAAIGGGAPQAAHTPASVPSEPEPSRARECPVHASEPGARSDESITLVERNAYSQASPVTPGDRGRVKRAKAVLNAKQSALFDRFWAVYPKKRSRQQAIRAFAKLDADDEAVNAMVAAVERAKKTAEWRRDGGKYIPYPATYLNAAGWLDEIPEEAYTQAQAEVIALYNSILGAAGWPQAVTEPYSVSRASAIDEFLGFSTKPGMPERYFAHCAKTIPADDSCGFDWLIRRSTYLRIREGVIARKQQFARYGEGHGKHA